MKLRYTPEAIRDLQELKNYISKVLYNPKAAVRISRSILDSCALLKANPQLGISVEAKTGYKTDLRYLICEEHLAFYRVEKTTMSVSRIINGRQDYLRILFGEVIE